MRMLWFSSEASKFGGRITATRVGRTRAETRASCEYVGCAFLDTHACHAWDGRIGVTLKVQDVAAEADPSRYRPPFGDGTETVRFATIGDPAILGRQGIKLAFAQAIQAGARWVLNYSHGWAFRDLQGLAMASCQSLEQAAFTQASGYRPFLAVPPETPTGTVFRTEYGRIVQCPADRTDGRITCAQCNGCDPRRSGPGYWIRAHGKPNTARNAARIARGGDS